MEPAEVRDVALVLIGGHAHPGGVGEDVAAEDGLMERLPVLEIVQGDGTGGRGLGDGLQALLHPGPEGVLQVEDGDLRRPLQGRLDGDGGGGSAAAQEDDLLPLHLHAAAAEVLGVAAAVGVVAHEGAVLIDDGVDGLDGLGGGGQFIEVGDDGVFAGHGDVGAPHPQGADGLDGIPGFLLGDVEGQVGPVQSELLEAVVIHGRGLGMLHRGADEPQQGGGSGEMHELVLLASFLRETSGAVRSCPRLCCAFTIAQ